MAKVVRTTEYRTTTGRVETRSGGRRVGGYASVFGKMSQDLGGFLEQVNRKAFNKTLADGANVVCPFNHEDLALLGTTRSGTLRLSTDNTGLLYEVDLPECRADVFEMVQRGDLTNSSFAFQAVEEDWGSGPSGIPVRTLLSCRLIDVAPVVSPAYPDASVGLRSLARFIDAPIGDVVELSQSGELRRLFTRTDLGAPLPRSSSPVEIPQPAPTPVESTRALSGAEALVELMDRRYPGGRPPVSKSGQDATRNPGQAVAR